MSGARPGGEKAGAMGAGQTRRKVAGGTEGGGGEEENGVKFGGLVDIQLDIH